LDVGTISIGKVVSIFSRRRGKIKLFWKFKERNSRSIEKTIGKIG
jgi:hypothetical protein